MKRGYWLAASGVVLVGFWWMKPRFVVDSTAKRGAPTTPSERESTPSTASAVGNGTATSVSIAPSSAEVTQKVGALYAARAPAPPEGASEFASPEELSVVEEATLVRKPVIDAIRLLGVSKAEKFERMREALHDSGNSTEAWTKQASSVFSGWANELHGAGNLELDAGSVRCFLAGCEGLVYFKGETDYEAAAQAFRSFAEPSGDGTFVHGGRVQTPPKQLPDGRWVAAWLMMRPNVGVE